MNDSQQKDTAEGSMQYLQTPMIQPEDMTAKHRNSNTFTSVTMGV